MKKSKSSATHFRVVSLLLRFHALAGLRAALALVAALPFQPVQATAAVTEAWVRRYSNVGDSVDQAFHVVRDPGGDFLVAGVTADAFAVQGLLLIKYSGADGSVLWQRRYDGPAANLLITREFGPPWSIAAAAVDSSGNLVVTAMTDYLYLDYSDYTTSDYFNHYKDFYTAKYSGADGALLWERYDDGPPHGHDVPLAMAVDASGNVVVTGYSQVGRDWFLSDYNYPTDIYTAKYAGADGALLWEKRYDGPAHSSDFPYGVAVDGNGNVIVTGVSFNLIDDWGNFDDGDIYTAKYSGVNGTLLWEKRYSASPSSDEIGRAVAVDGSGNVVVTGFSAMNQITFDYNYDYYTAKYAAADGALLWERRYNGPANQSDFPAAIVMDPSGNTIVTGVSHNTSDYSNGDYYTAKYAAADGALLWQKQYDGPSHSSDFPQAVAVDASGNVLVTGISWNGTNADYYTAKYAAANGTLLWEKRYNGPSNQTEFALATALDASGNIVVTGVSQDDIYTAKYAAASGALLWDKRYNGAYNLVDQGEAVAVDSADNVVVTGYSVHSLGGASPIDYDYYTAKYAAADGALLWAQRYNSPGKVHDIPVAVAVDASGNVIVTGSSQTGASATYTAKYAAGNGALLWEKISTSLVVADMALDTSGNVLVTSGNYTAKYAAADGSLLWERQGPNAAYLLAVDATGNVAVSGSSPNADFGWDSYTAKYAAADGAIVWERSTAGSADFYFLAQAAAVDPSGNVLVTGLSGGDFYTAKYAAANGALLWEKRYNGPVNGTDEAFAIAVDGSGNVVVTGESIGSTNGVNFNWDFYTAKYAAANGALLWERRYNGPANGNDSAKAVAVDASGNVVVTGNSAGRTNSTERDYYTTAYAAADGALLWEKRYNGPANGDDFVAGRHSLALGRNGMVAITGASDGSFGRALQTYDYATVVYREALPTLRIVVSNSFAVLSWPASFGNFQLQENTNVSLANGWSAVAETRSTNNNSVSVALPATGSRKFFRLSLP